MYKTKLQELCHQQAWDLPVYSTVKDGQDHCPRFTSTVTVNGVPFQSPQNQCKSSKDAQNVAAKLAFDYFSPSPPPALSSSNVDVRPAKNENATPSGHKNENRPKDLLHLYKNRLQHYSQKKSDALPEYSFEFDGPPHARRFRASVMIDGRTYQSPEYYPTLKDAEHAAAKVALESLSLGDIEEDEGLYKTLLQELAQKEGFYFPSYSTTKTGPAHMPTFVSTVQVGGEIYQGRECKTKKQAEMNVAKVAYNVLLERRTINTPSPGCSTKEEIEVPSLSSQPIISDNCRQSTGADTSTEIYEEIAAVGTGQMNGKSCVLFIGSDSKESLESSSPSLDSAVTNELLQNMPLPTDKENLDAEAKGQMNGKFFVLSHGSDRKESLESSTPGLNSAVTNDLQQNMPSPTDEENLDAEAKGGEPNAKRYKCSSPTENRHHHSPETFTLIAPSSCTVPSALVESDATKTAGGNNVPGSKVIVSRCGSNMETPEGASILPCSNNELVAAKVELNENPRL